ncbi:MAG: glycoside hydrolase family 38 C-terminal domain-containing protein, partial [Acetivibrio ethanolgignens]
LVYLEHLPSKGSQTFQIAEGKEEQIPFVLKENVLDTPIYRIEWNEKGLFTSIYDKENQREVLQRGKTANLFRMYEDKPIYYDNWDIDIYYSEKYWDVDNVTHMEWTELGLVRATLEIERRISNSLIRQKIHFYAKSRRIDFDTYVDWKEHQHLLKVHFPVDIHTDEATFDIQFGNLTRKVHTNTSWDMARFESCGQKWMDLSEGHYGVSLLNDCKYGHSVKDSDMALTLIKSGIEPNKTADQEEHFFMYALYPHAEGWRQAKTVEEAYKLNYPAYAHQGGKGYERMSAVSVDKTNVMIETVKLAEDENGIILRLYEFENSLTRAHIRLNFGGIGEIMECNLIEEELERIPVEGDGFSVTLKPYEIKTYRIRME